MHNTDSILVSIIICFKDDEVFLPEAIESVLHQTYPNRELILVDDGATVEATRHAHSIATKYPGQVCVVEHPGHLNLGLSASRNLGISKARGEMICFLDADDIILPDKISYQIQLFTENPAADILCEASEYWYSWEDPKKRDETKRVGTPAGKCYHPPELMIALYPLGNGTAPCMHSLMIRKSLIDDIGGFEPSFTGMYEDQVFLSKVYLNKIVFVSEQCHNKYRIRKDSMSQQAMKNNLYQKFRTDYFQWLTRYMEVQRIDYREVNKLIQYQFNQENSLQTFFKKILFKILPLKKD